jgi:hypothetical protein
MKFIEKNMFTIKKEADNKISMGDSFLTTVVRSLLPTEFISMFQSETSGHDIKTHLSPFNGNEKESVIDYEESHYQYSLTKYLYVMAYKTQIYISAVTDKELKEVNYGSFSPIHYYLRYKYTDFDTMNLSNMMSLKYYIEYSRYEYVLISKALNKLVLGNKQGDISVYNLELIVNDDNKITFNDSPVAILDISSRLAGIRLHDTFNENDESRNYFILYILTTDGRFESYKFMNTI